ncbi:protein Lines homolog 1 [Carlito syrichta]|uniref:Protein Lines homolog 1 n=1 Tax=Carlito syrichta TaxID=1868482 RepID=A0A1U7U4M3_CARSF|nr:protein Lines homolog 1 [Carlito syrichta]XP_021573719.1 protein Lines homolog 1 [Carlito syrichta]
MQAFCEVLEQLYKKVLRGATLENESHDYIFYLMPAFPDQDCSTTTSLKWASTFGVQGKHWPPSVGAPLSRVAPVCLKMNSQMSGAREVTLLQLTVINTMTARILSVETEFHAKKRYRDIIKILLESAVLDSKLICMFQNSDKLLSHMAAKCLALLLYFQLREKITLSNFWIAFCQENLSEYSESDKVMYCLWTLTAVIKEIFKNICSQKIEILKQFLNPFDTVLEVFYSSLFSQHFENCQNTSKIISSLMCFLELLELLIASRIYLKLHFTCQRILFLKPSCVLEVITWPIQTFVKRKFIIFIKKCLLRKVGEDLCRGPMPALMPPDCHLEVDILALANAVLQAVNLGLLKTLSVHGKPSFGGEVQLGCDHVSGPDHVTLGAVSLVIMKSLEIKLQNCTSAKEMKVDLQRFMSELLTFLKPHLQPSLQMHDPCEWLSRVFIEQDDDMLEAAKASVGIYLTLTRECEATESLTQEKEMWNHLSHDNGYNPHCIFLYFLKNIGFDSTVLLDFLISSETCFLEYFVRYLKLLQKDWNNFFTICKDFDVAESKYDINVCDCVPSLVQDQTPNHRTPHNLTAPGSHINAYAGVSWAADTSSDPLNQVVMSKETHTSQVRSLSSPWASQSLVDYDSSDDSEVESTDQCLASSKETSLHQEVSKKIQGKAGTSRDRKELSLGPPSRPLLPKELDTPFSVNCEMAPDNIVSKVGIFYRIVKCFEELQNAVYRLQTKNLFPYNPTALLKLLRYIEAMCNKSMNHL